jgi:hypothetical protein
VPARQRRRCTRSKLACQSPGQGLGDVLRGEVRVGRELGEKELGLDVGTDVLLDVDAGMEDWRSRS